MYDSLGFDVFFQRRSGMVFEKEEECTLCI